MRRIKRAKPSPALTVAVVALVAALAGTAVGGVAVTSLNKKDKRQVKKIARKLDRKIELTPGPPGEQGVQGGQGEQGPPGTSGYERVKKDLSVQLTNVGSTFSSVECPGEKEPLGGGVDVTSAKEPGDDVSYIRDVRLIETHPAAPPSRRWAGGIRNAHLTTLDIEWTIWATCANVE